MLQSSHQRRFLAAALFAGLALLAGCFPGQLDAPSERTLPVVEPEGAGSHTSAIHGSPPPIAVRDGGALD
jgi:hypothetical protein